MACQQCKEHENTIRAMGKTLLDIKRAVQVIMDRPGIGGRAIADRGFRSS